MMPAGGPHADTAYDIDCSPHNWFPALTSRLKDQASYLYSLGDDSCGAKAGTCSRVSCSYDAAVYFCNYRPAELSVTCSSLGDLVMAIVGDCTQTENDGSQWSGGVIQEDLYGYDLWIGGGSGSDPVC